MPLTLNVGISKKLGQPDYGSLGATCHVTVELDQGLLQHDLETFHRHVRTAFAACREAVNSELTLRTPPDTQTLPSTNGHDQLAQNQGGNGHPRIVGRAATQSQVRAIRAIASKHRVDLAGLLRERFCVARPEELSVPEASAVIDELKETAQQVQAPQ